MPDHRRRRQPLPGPAARIGARLRARLRPHRRAQGACQAIEDAHCLSTEAAKLSAESDLDWSRVLAAYEQTRTARTARVQSTARVWGDIWHVDGLARSLRNELLRDRDPADHKQLDWLYGV